MVAFKTEWAGPKANLVKGITLPEARASFRNRMLNPKQVYEFAKTNPDAFKRIIQATNLNMGVAVSKDAPLGEFVRNGDLEISAESDGEQRLLVIPESKLAKNALRIPNSLLLIKSGYTIDQCGSTFTIAFDKNALIGLRYHVQLFSKPPKDDWYGAVDGMPVGNASNPKDPNALFYYSSTALGSVQRGNISGFGVDDWRYFKIGGRFDVRYGVLVQNQ